jgi:hypothetical protein
MKRLLIAYAFALVGVLLSVLPAQAGIPIYSGNLQVQNGANLTFLNGASGCLLVNNGTVYTAACPIGTVAFSASSPFTVTGVGPYVIGCPTCFTTTGGTITGATIFSTGTTFQTAATFQNGLSSSAGGIFSEAGYPSLANAFSWHSGGAGNVSGIGASATATVQSVGGSLFVIGDGTTHDLSMNTSGDMGVRGQVSATQFNVLSKRAYKFDIQPLSFDALQVLHHTNFEAFRYRPGHGDPRLPHIGIIADDSPSVLSGEKHDHLDIEALATVDGAAILQLDAQMQVLYILIATLTILVLMLVVALGLVWRDKTAS